MIPFEERFQNASRKQVLNDLAYPTTAFIWENQIGWIADVNGIKYGNWTKLPENLTEDEIQEHFEIHRQNARDTFADIDGIDYRAIELEKLYPTNENKMETTT